MNGLRFRLAALLMVALTMTLATTARLALHAQDPPKETAAPESTALSASNRTEGPSPSVQDALVRPFHLPFGTPTRLDEVCRHLRRALHAPVVLDLAALERQNVRPDDTVELELDGVRLMTGLKLLLDQVGLTYRVVPEDNLLILTDQQGSDDPLKQVQAEIHKLHVEMHDVRDALDQVIAAMGLDAEGAKLRQPTIIEEMPQGPIQEKVEPEPTTPAPRPRRGI